MSNRESHMPLEVAGQLAALDWYHAIALPGGFTTPGRFGSNVPPNYTLFPVFTFLESIDVTGTCCIDIGTTDGIVAFTLKQEGAARVVATDRAERPTVALLREILDLDIAYLPRATLDNDDILKKLHERTLPEKFDLVVLAGVIYHAYDPLHVLMHARRLLRNGGLLIVETAHHPGDAPTLHFNTETEKPVYEPNTYFLPTVSCLQAFARFISCNPLATIINGNRVGLLAQACRPSEVEAATDVLRLIVRDGSHYGPLKFDELEADRDASSIAYRGRRGTWSMNMWTFETPFPLQPR